ncbi:hypothetical protein M407DRAFT_33914 [Tulasnella calospora MUT 4182]|uniref:Uncharacterized protein n=1 Tax=Tulasnella calospora MUT 4182 TaxID=1051891 RepID=A0A0C3PPL2_9AGAM|nr:hypothetical protein M407DRAFT_33914 [Tulasnella calospora MUT 4182]
MVRSRLPDERCSDISTLKQGEKTSALVNFAALMKGLEDATYQIDCQPRSANLVQDAPKSTLRSNQPIQSLDAPGDK